MTGDRGGRNQCGWLLSTHIIRAQVNVCVRETTSRLGGGISLSLPQSGWECALRKEPGKAVALRPYGSPVVMGSSLDFCKIFF